MRELVPTCTPDVVVSAPQNTRLIDVRKAAARRESGKRIVGSVWVDPDDLSPKHPLFADPAPLTFFCVHGHEVSTYACALARYLGKEAKMVSGGFEALVAAGAQTETFE
ncbi:MAG: rhodanese-like domain-containing protein [Pseudomonadota bacterium]